MVATAIKEVYKALCLSSCENFLTIEGIEGI